MTYQPLREYLKSKQMRQQTPFTIINGQGFFNCKGMLIEEKEFDAAWPLGEKIIMSHNNNFKGDNPDKTQI